MTEELELKKGNITSYFLCKEISNMGCEGDKEQVLLVTLFEKKDAQALAFSEFVHPFWGCRAFPQHSCISEEYAVEICLADGVTYNINELKK